MCDRQFHLANAVRNTQLPGSIASRTQRASNLPESFSVSVAVGPAASAAASRLVFSSTWKPLQMPRISLPASRNVGQRVGQVVLHLIAQDPPGRDVVAVAEPAGDAEHLKIGHAPRLLQHAIDVPPLRRAAGQLESVRSFLVAIGAGRSQDQDTWLYHVIYYVGVAIDLLAFYRIVSPPQRRLPCFFQARECRRRSTGSARSVIFNRRVVGHFADSRDAACRPACFEFGR